MVVDQLLNSQDRQYVRRWAGMCIWKSRRCRPAYESSRCLAVSTMQL